MSISDREWLDGLQVGDEVYIPAQYGEVGSIHKVSRTTKTQIIVATKGELTGNDYEDRFWRKTGDRVGTSDGYNTGYIAPVTDDIRTRIARARLLQKTRYKIHNTSFSDLPTATLQAICNLLPEPSKPDRTQC